MTQVQKIRLFIGTYSEGILFQNEYEVLKQHFKRVSRGKWVERENLHFTNKFIGDFPVNKLGKLKDDLSSLLRRYDSTLRFKGLNVFPNLTKPRILHVPVHHDGILDEINNRISECLADYSIILDDNRIFRPHITLQRIKYIDIQAFKVAVNDYFDYDFGQMKDFEVCLIESRLTSKGPIYTIHRD